MFVTPTFAQNEPLSQELQALLDEALVGTPEEVEAQLEALLAANPEQAAAITTQARAQAPQLVTAINNANSTFVASNNNRPANTGNQNTNNTPGGALVLGNGFVLSMLNPNEIELGQQIVQFANLPLLSQPAWLQQMNTFNSFVDFQTCALGLTVSVGPYAQ